MIYRTMLALLLLALLSACATGPRVYTSTAPGADLSSYQRFAFVQPLGTQLLHKAGPI